jgi:hypothetical protein
MGKQEYVDRVCLDCVDITVAVVEAIPTMYLEGNRDEAIVACEADASGDGGSSKPSWFKQTKMLLNARIAASEIMVSTMLAQ